MSLFSALFNPGSVALIGASADPGKDNSRAQRLLQRELLVAGYGIVERVRQRLAFALARADL